MSLFVPPRPADSSAGQSWLARRIAVLRSGLGAFQSGSYGKGTGRYGFPTLPRFEKRWIYTVRDPELVREMLVKRAPEFPKADVMDAMLGALTGYSIFISNGEIWGRQRRLIDPALEQARVRDVFARMLEAADQSMARIEAAADTDRPFAIDTEMSRFAADVIFRTIFSEPVAEPDATHVIEAFEVFQGVAYAHGMMGLTRWPSRLMPGWGKARKAARTIRAALNKPLAKRLADKAAGRPVPDNDILAALIDGVDPVTGTGFDGEELLDQIAMLFLAGHETSASALAWSLYLLAEAPEVQARCQAEADAVLGDESPAFEQMKRLALTRDVFREAMRLYPPVAFLARDCPAGGRLGRREVEPGSMVMASTWLTHRGDQWAEPHAFDPDRFSCPAGRGATTSSYFPFSIGPRVCPGAAFALQESTLLLGMAMRRFSFSADAADAPQPVARLTLRSANGLRLKVRRREASA